MSRPSGPAALPHADARGSDARGSSASGTNAPGRGYPGSPRSPPRRRTGRPGSSASASPSRGGSGPRSPRTDRSTPRTPPDARGGPPSPARASPPPPRSPRRTLGSPLAAPGPRRGPPGCIPTGGRVAPPRTPFFRPQVPLERLLDLGQRLGHPQPGGVQRPPRIVVEDPPHRGAILEHHAVGGGDRGTRPVRRRDGGVRGVGGVRRGDVARLGL